MSNQSWPGVSSLVLNEPLLWEKGRPGRVGVSPPPPMRRKAWCGRI